MLIIAGSAAHGNGRTIESAGGRGPTRRSWLTPVLLSRVEACYVLTAGS